MAATDAKAVPIKNQAYRVTFPILDADGDLVTGATGLDSEVSIDGAAFADCTNEATEIATSSGMYYLDLTSSEMNGDTIAIIVKTSSSGAKTTPIVLYTAARSINDLAYPTTSGRSIDVTATGEVGIDWANIGGATTAVNLSGTTVKTATDVETDTADIQSRLPAALVSGRIDASVGAVAANAITASAIAADAVTEIQSGLSTLDAAGIRTAVGLAAANLDTQLTAIDDFLDTEIAAIKAKTDQLTFTTANQLDATAVTVSDKTGYALTAGERNSVADALLDRNMATGTDSGSATVRTVRQALRFMRNKWENSGGTLTVYKEDDTTASWTASTTTAAGDPVSSVDPASA